MIDTIKNFIAKNRLLSGALAAAGLGIVAFLAFGYFGVQFLFIDDEVDEANPFALPAVAVEGDAEVAADGDTDAELEPTVPESVEVVTEARGVFTDGAHPTSGDATVITDGERRFLRFENFESDNGPDLNVYLRADDGSFIDLGDLKGNIGDQNYELTDDVDLSQYDTVDIWCVRFGVSFGTATLA